MINTLYKKHIISINELSRQELELVVNTAVELKLNPNAKLLENKVVASCFFEPSTRTRLSFDTAIQRLGGQIIGFDNASNTSHAKKGETLADSVRMITAYADAMVMRHPNDGAARLASLHAGKTPIINAGDGSNQHPTQTLLDLFSIYETQGRLNNLNVAFVGDLKYGRTVHSLTQALAKFDNNRFYFIAPESLSMPEYLCEELSDAGIHFSTHSDIESVLPELDILYMTRVQKERFDESEYAHIKSAFILTSPMLTEAKENLKILHPLPRVDEITTDVDDTPYAYYFEQAENGVYAREALLALLLNETLC